MGKLYYRMLALGLALFGVSLFATAAFGGRTRLAWAFESPTGERLTSAVLGLACLALGIAMFRLPRPRRR